MIFQSNPTSNHRIIGMIIIIRLQWERGELKKKSPCIVGQRKNNGGGVSDCPPSGYMPLFLEGSRQNETEPSDFHRELCACTYPVYTILLAAFHGKPLGRRGDAFQNWTACACVVYIRRAFACIIIIIIICV